MSRTFFEFFAGGGMARLGLGPQWQCLFANDFDEKKAETYLANHFDSGEFHLGDIRTVSSSQIKGEADLVWASFPCQDLSIAGSRRGLSGNRSGTYWPFWRLIETLVAEDRAPKIIVLENVVGALSSHGGDDFREIAEQLHSTGYSFGGLIIDAVQWVPQSRPRLFVVCVRGDLEIPSQIIASDPEPQWHPKVLKRAYDHLSGEVRGSWNWWTVPEPPMRNSALADLLEENPTSCRWHSEEETARLISLMSPVHLRKLQEAKGTSIGTDKKVVGAVYRRTRGGQQRAEVRFDDISGCLRTPSGGSSRQTILLVEGKRVRSRLLSAREAARLMGVPDDYVLPENYNAAYHLAGDGVAVPIVRHLSEYIFEPILLRNSARVKEAA